jgi:hypothetical protein
MPCVLIAKLFAAQTGCWWPTRTTDRKTTSSGGTSRRFATAPGLLLIPSQSRATTKKRRVLPLKKSAATRTGSKQMIPPLSWWSTCENQASVSKALSGIHPPPFWGGNGLMPPDSKLLMYAARQNRTQAAISLHFCHNIFLFSLVSGLPRHFMPQIKTGFACLWAKAKS